MNLTFLIRREGDREWLPLESPTVEVLEGRYHLIAHTDASSQPIGVQIRHRYVSDGVLQEERQQHQQQPDVHGNLSLLPDAHLGHGLWTLTCAAPDLHSQRQSISLQVLAEDYEQISDWEFVETTLGNWPQTRAEWSAVLDATATIPDGPQSEEQSLDVAALVAEVEPLIITHDEVTPELSPAMDSRVTLSAHVSPSIEMDECGTSVSLPVLPQDFYPVALQRSQGTKLPPKLQPTQPTSGGSPELPHLPRHFHWRYIPLDKLSKVPNMAHRSDIEQAFTALELQQRFRQTLHQLVDPSSVSPQEVQVWTHTAG